MKIICKKFFSIITFIFFIPAFASSVIHTWPTQTDKDSHPLLSPDGKWIAFVRQSHHLIPDVCAAFSDIDSPYGNEIWIYDLKTKKERLLVSNKFACNEPTEKIVDPQNLQFSPDSKELYFGTSAWTVSGAIHAVGVDGKNLRFVTDGNEYHIVMRGRYKGDLIVNQHRYHDRGGSYDWDWLFTPAGKQIKLYQKEN